MGKRATKGLVFAMPVGKNQYGFGQLVEKRAPIWFMVAFDLIRSEPQLEPQEVERAEIIAMGNFFDVLIRNGRWTSLDVMPVRDVLRPCFKVKIGDDFIIESWDRSKSRVATEEELGVLTFRANHGPIILENCVRNHFGDHPDEDVFETLRPAFIEKGCSLF